MYLTYNLRGMAHTVLSRYLGYGSPKYHTSHLPHPEYHVHNAKATHTYELLTLPTLKCSLQTADMMPIMEAVEGRMIGSPSIDISQDYTINSKVTLRTREAQLLAKTDRLAICIHLTLWD